MAWIGKHRFSVSIIMYFYRKIFIYINPLIASKLCRETEGKYALLFFHLLIQIFERMSQLLHTGILL